MALKRVIDLVAGDKVDLQGDEYADPDPDNDKPHFEYEYQVVMGLEHENEECVRVDFEHTSVGFAPDHRVTIEDKED